MKLFQNFKSYEKNIALSDGSQKITYKKLILICNEINQKIKKNSLLLIFAGNNIGSIISYIFSQRYGFPSILINEEYEKKEIVNLIKIYKPEYIFSEKKHFQKFKKNSFYQYFNFLNFNLYKTKIKSSTKVHKNISLLLPTSGTMGTSKIVKLSKENLKFNTDSIINYLKINQKNKTITNLPISYSFMLSVINTHLESGAFIYVTHNSIIQKKFWEDFNLYEIDSFNGVPYSYEILLKLKLEKVFRGQKIRYFTQAGGGLEKEKLRKILKFSKRNKIKFYSMYGQTEASPRISYLNPKYSLKKIGSIGKPIKNTQMWLENENNTKITEPYKKGEIIFKGKNIFVGYAKNIKDLQHSESIKVLKTGDIGFFDKQKFFYITGRKNRICKIFGTRIDLNELELKLKKIKFDVCCVSKDNNIFAAYTKNYNNKKLQKLISNFTRQSTNNIFCERFKSLPRNKSNKIDFSKIIKLMNND